MLHVKKYSTTFISALIVTYALMLMMSSLINNGKNVLVTVPDILGTLDFIRVPEPIKPVIAKTPVKPDPAEVPPLVKQIRAINPNPSEGDTLYAPPVIPPVVDPQGAFQTSGHLMPVFVVTPHYPQSAARRGIEGHVVVMLTVSRMGAVINPVVIEAEPKGYFESAAIKAVKRFKYQPQLDANGQAVETEGVRYQFTFELDQ